MKIFFSVGEPSGDQHAAHLMQAFHRRRPDIEFVGFGGPLMQQSGCSLMYQLTDLAVMGVVKVIPLLFQFISLARQAGRYFRETPPDAVVLVDFPGFNWWIARKAKAAGVPVFYYLPPQLWAWAPWRVRKVRKFVDHMLCSLPFEKDWYAKRGVSVEYVGHPFFDEISEYKLDNNFCQQWSGCETKNVAILPGSRNEEVSRNWPILLDAINRLHQKHPDVRFLVANYKESHRQKCEEEFQARGTSLPIHFFVGKTSEIIQIAQCSLMVSGSVSLEMLARAKPAVVLYHAGWVFMCIAKLLVTCKYISLPNLIAGREVLPEIVSVGNRQPAVNKLVQVVHRWLDDDSELERVTAELQDLRDNLFKTGASGQAADVILGQLSRVSIKLAA